MKIVNSQNQLGMNNLPVLAQEKYLKIKSDNYGWFEDENYILPYFIDKRLIFKRMVFTYGLIPKKDNLNIDNEKQFLNNMVKYVKKHKMCDFIYKAQSNVVFNVCPDGSDCVEWGTYYVNLIDNYEQLLMTFHGKHRNVIRNALKNGVIIKESDNLEKIYNCIRDTLSRQGSIHFPSFEYINNLYKNLRSNVLMLEAIKNNELQGVAIIIYDNDRAYYMYGGSKVRPFTGSLNLLQFEAMKILHRRGVKVYDFVGARINVEKGSKYEGLQRFKERFGATLQKGYAFRYIVNPLKFKLFNLISKNYLKLKGYNYIDPIDSIKSMENQ